MFSLVIEGRRRVAASLCFPKRTFSSAGINTAVTTVLNGRYKLVRDTNHEDLVKHEQAYLEVLEPCNNVSEQAGEEEKEDRKVEKELSKYISILNLNRPQAKNALGTQLITEFNSCLAIIKSRLFTPSSPKGSDSIAVPRVLLIRSSVSRVFCAGADLRERLGMSEGMVESFVSGLRDSFSALEKVPIPTVAVIEGAALGGGLELALACDLRIASARAKLGLPETGLAIIPGAGGTQRLPRIVGYARAKELILTGRLVQGADAERIGLINQYVQEGGDNNPGAVLDKSIFMALGMAARGPVAMQAAKAALDLSLPTNFSSMAIESLCYGRVIPTTDRIEGLKSFIEGRPANYKGE